MSEHGTSPSSALRLVPEDGSSIPAGRSDAQDNGRARHYLHSGQIFVSSEPYAVTTVLGSCVAVCIWDAVRRAGGINHYLLPQMVGTDASPRFGVIAIPLLIEKLMAAGSSTANLQAKIFGGACIASNPQESSTPKLGEQNVALARRLLGQAKIPVVGEDVGGRRGRRLVFQIDEGLTSVRVL